MLHRYNHIDKWNCFIYFTFKMQIFCIRMTSQTFLRHLVMFVFFINIFSFIDLSQLFHITSMNIKCIYKKNSRPHRKLSIRFTSLKYMGVSELDAWHTKMESVYLFSLICIFSFLLSPWEKFSFGSINISASLHQFGFQITSQIPFEFVQQDFTLKSHHDFKMTPIVSRLNGNRLAMVFHIMER